MGYLKRRTKVFFDSNYVVIGGVIGFLIFLMLMFILKGGGNFRSAAAGIFGAIVAGATLGGLIEKIKDKIVNKNCAKSNQSLKGRM